MIYVLEDPRTSEVRYVGFSSQHQSRYEVHIDESRKGCKSYKCSWIRELLALSLMPILKVVEEVEGDWRESERWWIKFYREEVGARLTNLTDGGEGVLGLRMSEESKARVGAASSRKVMSEETKQKLREIRIGWVHTEESIQKMRKPKSEEFRRKLTGRRHSAAAIQNMSKPKSEQHRLKIAAAVHRRNGCL